MSESMVRRMSNVVIIGTGNVGGPLAQASRREGHTVTALTSSSEADASSEALRAADIIVLATPFDAALSLPASWRSALAGKVVIDATNPLTPDFSALTVGFDTSGAEQIAASLEGARVVKALNAVLAPNHDTASHAAGSIFVPLAGDDVTAVETATAYLSSLGFDAVASGALKNSRYIEPLAELMIQLAYFRGEGTGISLTLQRA